MEQVAKPHIERMSCLQDAIEACYSILGTVQRLWRKVKDEDDDDYIAIPKPSGYQSLHTAVIGKDPPASSLRTHYRSRPRQAILCNVEDFHGK